MLTVLRRDSRNDWPTGLSSCVSVSHASGGEEEPSVLFSVFEFLIILIF